MKSTLTILIFTIACVQAAPGAAPSSTACTKLNEDALARVAQGRLMEAKNMLSAELASGIHADCVCAGLIMNNVASLLLISGRPVEAEVMAERSVHSLKESFPPDHVALLRPLHILAAAQFEQGKIARARGTFDKMLAIRATRPEDSELMYAMAGPLLEAEGKWPEAESQYVAAIQVLKEAGRGDTADAATLLCSIAGLYVREHRMGAARQALNEAQAIFERAPDADPWDRIKLIRAMGVLCGREGRWREAEQDLANALSIADRESRVEPTALRPLLIDYAVVLRKNHRRGEARSIETRIAALGAAPQDREVVSVSDLLARPRT